MQNTLRKSLYYTRDYYAALEPTPKDREHDHHLAMSHVGMHISCFRLPFFHRQLRATNLRHQIIASMRCAKG